MEGGDIRLTESGRQFADGTVEERKSLFERQLLNYVPLAGHVRRVLEERASHTAPRGRFLDELEDYMTADAALESLRAVISWARYAGAFYFDAETAAFSLESEE